MTSSTGSSTAKASSADEVAELYQYVIDTIDQGYCRIQMIFDSDDKPVDYLFLEINALFSQQTGLVDAQGKRARELVPNLEQKWFDLYGRVAQTGEAAKFQESSDEMGRWFNVCANRFGGEDSRQVVVLFSDISMQKQAELAREIALQQVEDVLESMGDSFFMLNESWEIIRVNSSYERVAQINREESIGKNFWELFSAAVPGTKYWDEYHAVMATRQYRQFVDYYAPLDVWTEVNVYPTRGGGISVFFRDVSERKQLERQKDDFLGVASHELKTPVTSLKAYTQLLQRRFSKTDDEFAVDKLTKMNTQLDKLSSLIEDILDVTKIEAGQLPMRITEFDFDQLVAEIIDLLQLTAEEQTLTFEAGGIGTVKADRDRLEQVLINLVSNAIKYSPAHGTITISSQRTKGGVTLAVRDQGIGIAPEKQGRLFERFFRVSGPDRESFPGLGLGLYISAEIMKRLGGRIWVESQGIKGDGSTFHVYLPQ